MGRWGRVGHAREAWRGLEGFGRFRRRKRNEKDDFFRVFSFVPEKEDKGDLYARRKLGVVAHHAAISIGSMVRRRSLDCAQISVHQYHRLHISQSLKNDRRDTYKVVESTTCIT